MFEPWVSRSSSLSRAERRVSGLERQALLMEYRLVSRYFCSGAGDSNTQRAGLQLSGVRTMREDSPATSRGRSGFLGCWCFNILMHQRRQFMSTWTAYVGITRKTAREPTPQKGASPRIGLVTQPSNPVKPTQHTTAIQLVTHNKVSSFGSKRIHYRSGRLQNWNKDLGESGLLISVLLEWLTIPYGKWWSSPIRKQSFLARVDVLFVLGFGL